MQIIRRVLMTTDTIGGVWNYSIQLAQELRTFGIDVMLATMGTRLRSDQRLEADASNVRLIESEFQLEWMDTPWADVRKAGEWLLRLEQEFAPDVVHLNQYSFGSLPWKAPSLIVGHSCVLSWWEAVRSNQPIDRRLNEYRNMVSKGLQAADCVVAPSAAMLAALRKHYGERFRREEVIPNGRKLSSSEPDSKEPLVFTSGRIWDEAKNVASLSRICEEIEWPVYLAGDIGSMSLPSCSNLHYLGIVPSDEHENFMRRASIYVLPARYEPFGLSILEAAICRCALVLGNIDSLRENWRGAAIFVNPEKPEEIREAIRLLISDSEALEEYSSRAYERSMFFSAQRMALHYLRIYESLKQNAYRSAVQRSDSFNYTHK